MDKTRQNKVIREVVAAAEKYAIQEAAYYWVAELNRQYPEDIGVLSPLLLNILELEPGEAVFVPAGELHAYLNGLGLELMANSDNVLRGGLTRKYVDVPELLNVVDFKSGPVAKVAPIRTQARRLIYPTPCREFLLSRICVDEKHAYTSPPERSVEIMICLEGRAVMIDSETSQEITMASGQSVLVSAQIPGYQIKGKAVLWTASIP